MITPKQIEEKTMSPAKRAEAKNSIWGFYVGRPLTYVLTIPFLYTNISPNAITIISIVFVIASYVTFIVAETTGSRLLGLLFLFLWSMFDGIDGNVARFKNQKSASGDLLDTLGGYLAIAVVFLGIGSMGYHDPLCRVYVSREFILEMAGLSTAVTLIPRILLHRQASKGQIKSTESIQDKSQYSLPKIIALNICDPAGFQEHLILIAIVFHLEWEFTFCYLLLNLAIMVYSIFEMIKEKRTGE